MALQGFFQQHWLDDQGRPAGGVSTGKGFCISWQNGPLGQMGTAERQEPNGAFVEDVIQAVIGRIAFYQGSVRLRVRRISKLSMHSPWPLHGSINAPGTEKRARSKARTACRRHPMRHLLRDLTVFGWGLLIMAGLLLCWVVWLEASPASCTAHASNNASGSSCSDSSPCTIGTWLSQKAAPGGVLCLKDGTYTGGEQMLQFAAKSGTAGNPITVRAINDGAVTIDGQFNRRPLRLQRLVHHRAGGQRGQRQRHHARAAGSALYRATGRRLGRCPGRWGD